MKKRIMILIVLLGIVLYEAFMLWPRPLGSNLDKDSLYVIVSEAKNTKNEESFSESFINNRTWRIEKQSATSQQMIDILDDYYYHYNFESFFSKSSLDSKKNTEDIYMAIHSDKGYIILGYQKNIIIDEHVYPLGYMKNKKSQEVIERILKIMPVADDESSSSN